MLTTFLSPLVSSNSEPLRLATAKAFFTVLGGEGGMSSSLSSVSGAGGIIFRVFAFDLGFGGGSGISLSLSLAP